MKKNAFILMIWITVFFLITCTMPRAYQFKDMNKYDFQNGDILLQHLPSDLCNVIAGITRSKYSHCGIIVYKNNQAYILEAIGPVRYTPVKTWINQGVNNYFTQLRIKNLTEQQIRNVIKEAEKFLGKPYDIQYQLDEEKIYCSELIYKSFFRGAKMEISKKEKSATLHWKPYASYIRYLAGGDLLLDRILITPESLVQSTNTVCIYSSFPLNMEKDKPIPY